MPNPSASGEPGPRRNHQTSQNKSGSQQDPVRAASARLSPWQHSLSDAGYNGKAGTSQCERRAPPPILLTGLAFSVFDSGGGMGR